MHQQGKATKVTLYRSIVQAIVFFYNSETWTVKSEDKQKLRVLEMSALKKICGISKRNQRRNMDIIKELGVIEKNIVEILFANRADWSAGVTVARA